MFHYEADPSRDTPGVKPIKPYTDRIFHIVAYYILVPKWARLFVTMRAGAYPSGALYSNGKLLVYFDENVL